MINQVLDKIGGLPGYFWALALVWAVIELAGWLRMRRNRQRSYLAAWAYDVSRWGQWGRAPE